MEPLPFTDNMTNIARAALLMAELARETEQAIAQERSAHRVYGREVQER